MHTQHGRYSVYHVRTQAGKALETLPVPRLSNQRVSMVRGDGMSAPGPDGVVCKRGCDAWSVDPDCPQHAKKAARERDRALALGAAKEYKRLADEQAFPSTGGITQAAFIERPNLDLANHYALQGILRLLTYMVENDGE